MKKIIALLFVTLPLWAYTQISFKELIDGINWQGTENELVSKYHDNIQKTSHEEWADEESCSDYSFINVKLGDFIINQAPIRVDITSKSLFRVNFIVYEDSRDANLSASVDKQLIALLGAPIATEDDEGLGIISTYHKEWITNSYKVRSNLFVFGSDTYLYTISVEPIDYYPVDYTKAEIRVNDYAIAVPKILSFKIDNDGNVYIKKDGGIEVKKAVTNIHDTPKGLVFVFEGGMVCYREEDDDVVYLQQSFAALYPIRK